MLRLRDCHCLKHNRRKIICEYTVSVRHALSDAVAKSCSGGKGGGKGQSVRQTICATHQGEVGIPLSVSVSVEMPSGTAKGTARSDVSLRRRPEVQSVKGGYEVIEGV